VTSSFDDLLHSSITIKNNKLRLNNMSAKYDIFVEHAKDVTEDNNDTLLDVVIK
jgi:type II secretory pathway component PulL